MRPWLLVLAACGGSRAQPDAAGDGPSEAGGHAVTGRYIVREVRNDASHLPAVADVPPHALAINLRAPDGTTSPVTLAADGESFAFTASVLPYDLIVTADGAVPVDFELSAPHLDIAAAVVGRYDRAAVPASTSLVATPANAPGGGTAYVMTTGLWTQTARPNGSPNNNFTLDWGSAGSLSGSIGLLDAAANDRTYLTVRDSGGTPGPSYTRIVDACSVDVTTTGGTATSASCAMTASPQDQCIHMTAHVATELARITAATAGGFSYPTAGYDWFVFGAPAPSLGPIGGFLLADYEASGLPNADIDRTITFANPFPAHESALMMVGVRLRTVSVAGVQPFSSYILTEHTMKPDVTCTTVADVPGTVAIAALPSLDGVVLDNDDLTVTIDRSLPHALDWSLAAPGTADYFSVMLYAVSDTPAKLDLRHAWITPDAHLAIDPSVFEAGTLYMLEVVTFAGTPNAAQGDFRTVGYPATASALSTQLSSVFRVTD